MCNRLLIVSVGLCLAACSQSERRRPNVILIVVDTLRADSVLDSKGIYSTPAIDALARDGVLFERAYAHAPMTLPSHTSLFSSRPPIATGVVNNGQKVPEDLPLLPEWMGKFGYESRAVTSLGTLVTKSSAGPGLARGFESYDIDFWNIAPAEQVFERMNASLAAWTGERPLFFFGHFSDPHEPYDSHEETGRKVFVRLDGNDLAAIPSDNMTVWEDSIPLPSGRHKVEFIANHKFIVRYFSCRENGRPIEPEWENDRDQPSRRKMLFLERTGEGNGECEVKIWVNDVVSRAKTRERYIAEVEHVDRYVGMLIEQLKKRGLYDESLVIFTSDHGESLGEHGRVGHVMNLTDETIAVPLIIKPPRGTSLASRFDPTRVVRHVDLVPTILEIIGVPGLPGQDGLSLLQETEEPVLHFAETHKPEAEKDKLALHDGRYKMIYTVDDDAFRMFDLLEDPGELTDIYSKQSSLRPEWPDQLRRLAAIATQLTPKDGDLDREVESQLRALGYGG